MAPIAMLFSHPWDHAGIWHSSHSVSGWTNQLLAREIRSIAANVARQQHQPINDGVGANQEIGQNHGA
ncbi:hypothetical protein [uncultured Thiocystis sp.]|uniref:hypothetical protein n=1 Tax=uncultured Thiocystis sp. TaxID=1202134 RepID=UPI0025F6DFCC|nr:hypothetical protein [uncultured Thiocystis sp.]